MSAVKGVTYLDNAQMQLVADAVAANRNYITDTTLSFVAVADTHAANLANAQSPDVRSCRRAMTGITQAAYAALLDDDIAFIALMGDHLDGGSRDSATKKLAMEYLAASQYQAGKVWQGRSVPVLSVKGNHDDNSDYQKTVSYVIRGDEWHDLMVAPYASDFNLDTQRGKSNYYYLDFERQKIRVIVLEWCDYPWILTGGQPKYTAGSNRAGYGYSADQVNWLHREALDFSGKSDAGEWATLVLVHKGTRITDEEINQNQDLIYGILDAYNRKTAFQGENTAEDWAVAVNVDYSGDVTQGVLGVLAAHHHKDFTIPPYGSYASTSTYNNDWSWPIISFGAGVRSINGFGEIVTVDRDSKTVFTTSICDDAALSAEYTRSRMIPLTE